MFSYQGEKICILDSVEIIKRIAGFYRNITSSDDVAFGTVCAKSAIFDNIRKARGKAMGVGLNKSIESRGLAAENSQIVGLTECIDPCFSPRWVGDNFRGY